MSATSFLDIDQARDRARAEAQADSDRLIGALIRGEQVRIFGARVRLEWVDRKPPVADAWAAEVTR